MVGNRRLMVLDLKSLGGFHRAGSIPALGTSVFKEIADFWVGFFFLEIMNGARL